MKTYTIIILFLFAFTNLFGQTEYIIETNPGTPSSRYTLNANTDYSIHFNVFIDSNASLNGFKTTFDGIHELTWDLTIFEKNKWIEIAHDFTTTSQMVEPVLKIEMIDDVNTGFGSGFFYIDDIRIYDNSNLSVDEFDNEIVLYPNPASNALTFKNLSPNSEIVIHDLLGATFTPKLVTNGNNSHAINIANLSSGVYLIKITDVNKTITKKIIKH